MQTARGMGVAWGLGKEDGKIGGECLQIQINAPLSLKKNVYKKKKEIIVVH